MYYCIPLLNLWQKRFLSLCDVFYHVFQMISDDNPVRMHLGIKVLVISQFDRGVCNPIKYGTTDLHSWPYIVLQAQVSTTGLDLVE